MKWIEKNWQTIVLAVFIVGAVLFLWRREATFSERFDEQKAAHDAEIAAINEIRAREAAEHEVNVTKLLSDLDKAKQEYDAALKVLDEKISQDVAKIVNEYGDDPYELAKYLSQLTGFVVILPNEE
jgi:hypothetical protein